MGGGGRGGGGIGSGTTWAAGLPVSVARALGGGGLSSWGGEGIGMGGLTGISGAFVFRRG